MADHEFAPATLAARIAASAGTNLNACVMADIAAFDGPLTGLGSAQTKDMFRGAPRT